MEAELVELPNIRRYRRISVGPEHRIGFRINGIELRHIPISSLSAGGCFAVLPKAMVPNVHRGHLLLDFVLEHEELRDSPFCSRVAYVLQESPQVPDQSVGLGIAFLSTSLHFYEWVDAYVSAHSANQ